MLKRDLFSSGLLFALLLGSQPASAGVTYDFAFRSTDLFGNQAGLVSPDGHSVTFGGQFSDLPCGHRIGDFEGCLVSDLLLRTTTPLVSASFSIAFDPFGDLYVHESFAWSGQGVAFNMMGNPRVLFEPLEPSCSSFSCTFGGLIAPPAAPPSLPPGTYNLGTIVWNTSAVFYAFLGTQEISTVGVVGGIETDLTGSAVTTQGFLYLLPEPATAGLLALGIAGLSVIARHRRG